MKRSLNKSLTGFAVLGTMLLMTACAYHSHDDGDHSHNASHESTETMSSETMPSEAGHHDHNKMMQDKHMGDTGKHGHMSVDMKDVMQDGQKGSSHHGGGHHGDVHGGHHGKSLAGKPGQESHVDRVIDVEANDAMRFVHEPFNIQNGETIKFVITNKGAVPHEFSIGTKDEHMEHGQMMMKNPNMHHGPGGNAITVASGKTETLIWTFEKAWEVEAACNIPGHYQAGMHSPVKFRP